MLSPETEVAPVSTNFGIDSLGRLGLELFHGLIVATGNGDLHGREDAEGEE